MSGRLPQPCAGFTSVTWGMFALFAGHAIFKLTYLSNHDYKPLYFESDAATVNEIVLKVSSAPSSPVFRHMRTNITPF